MPPGFALALLLANVYRKLISVRLISRYQPDQARSPRKIKKTGFLSCPPRRTIAASTSSEWTIQRPDALPLITGDIRREPSLLLILRLPQPRRLQLRQNRLAAPHRPNHRVKWSLVQKNALYHARASCSR